MQILSKDQVIAFLRRSQKILCVTRKNPSRDGISAVLAAQVLLSRLGKEVICVLPEGVPESFKFLTGSEKVQKDLIENGDFVISISTGKADVERVKYTIEEDSVDILITPKKGNFMPSDVTFRQSAENFDLIVVLDGNGPESLGSVFENNTELFSQVPVLNLSVDPVNDFFGKVNLVDPSKSSVSELLFDLVMADNAFSEFVDRDLATIFLAGIVGATDSFLSSNTTSSALMAASKLQKMGGNQSEVIEHLFKRKSLNTLKIWGQVLGNLDLDPIHKIAWSKLGKSDFEATESSASEVDSILDMLIRFTVGSDLSVLFVEHLEGTEVQIRTSNPALNLAYLQQNLGGEFVDNGVNVWIESKIIAEIESPFLEKLLYFQKERLGVQDSVALQTQQLIANAQTSPAQTVFPIMHSVAQEVLVNPTPPAQIPFIAPKQPRENPVAYVDSVPPGTKAAEVILGSAETTIPDWLKSFSHKDGSNA